MVEEPQAPPTFEQRGTRPTLSFLGPGRICVGVAFLPHFLHHLVRSKQIHDRYEIPADSPAGREAEVPVGKGAQMTVRPISPQEKEDGGHEKGTQLGQNRELLNILGGMRQMPVEFGHLGVQAIDRQMGVKPRKQQDGMDDEHKLDGPGRLSGEKVHAFSPSSPRRLIKRIRPGSCMEPGLEASDESQILDSRGGRFFVERPLPYGAETENRSLLTFGLQACPVSSPKT